MRGVENAYLFMFSPQHPGGQRRRNERFFMKPLLCVAVSFMCGIAAGDYLDAKYESVLYLPLLAFIPALYFFCSKRLFVAFCLILATVFSIGIASITRRYEGFQRHAEALAMRGFGEMAGVRGTISESPSFSSFTVEGEQVLRDGNWENFRGRIRVINHTDNRDYDYGDYVEARGISAEAPPRRDISLVINAYAPSWIEIAGEKRAGFPMSLALTSRKRIAEVIRDTMPYPEGLILKSLLLGKRHVLPGRTRRTFTRIGMGHFLSVSGLHAGLVLLVLMTAGKALGLSRKQVSLVGIGGITFFCFLTGARVPTLRATVLACTVLSGNFLGRRPDSWNSLGMAAILILSRWPEQLFDPGFQLSFASVAGIFHLFPLFGAFADGRGVAGRAVLRPAAALVSIHLAVFPLMAHYFGFLPLIALFANLVMVPLMSIVVCLGLFGAAGVAHISLARIINAVNGEMIKFIIWLSEIFSLSPGLIPTERVGGFTFAVYYAGLILLPVSLGRFRLRRADEARDES